MAADVEKSADLALRVTDDENRVLAHVSGKEVAGLRDLALVAQEKPAAGEDPLQLLLVELRLDEDAATDQTLLGVDQPEHVGFHRLAPLLVLLAAARYATNSPRDARHES